jgi:hypothetical protein
MTPRFIQVAAVSDWQNKNEIAKNKNVLKILRQKKVVLLPKFAPRKDTLSKQII